MNKKKKTEIPIMFCFDKNYVIPAAVTFYSILEHANKEYDYHFYVLHSDINKVQQKKLKETIKEFQDIVTLDFINMEHRFEDIWNKIYQGGHFSKEVTYKILIASIFPQYEKIIVTDVDVVFLGDLSPSYIDFDVNGDYYVGGIKPIGKINSYLENYRSKWTDEEIKKLGHICGGYLVANLKKIREDNMEEVFVNSFVENGYRLNQMEQDILNLCCFPKIKYLPLNYVACSYMWDFYDVEEESFHDENYKDEEIKDAMLHPIQLHYATSIKPWKNVNCTKSEEWFKYITKTLFLEEYLEQLAKHANIDSTNKLLTQEKNHNVIYRTLSYIKHNPLFFAKKEFYYKIIRKLRSKISFLKKEEILYIFDDVFPSEKNKKHYEKILECWNSFDDVHIVLKEKNRIDKISDANELTSQFLKEHRQKHHQITIYPFLGPALEQNFIEQIPQYKRKLALVPSLNNLIDKRNGCLSLLEKYQIPFIFTLEQNDIFSLNDDEIDKKLISIFNSSMFQKVIVNDSKIKEYLTSNYFCRIDKITESKEVINLNIIKEELKGNKNGAK